MNRLLGGLLLAVCLALLVPPLAARQAGGKSDDGDKGPDGLKALTNPDPQVRFNAAELLGKLGKTAKFAVPQLRELLKDPSTAVRIKAVEAIWKIEHPEPKPLLAVLVAAANDKEEVFRAAALNVLGQFGDKAKPALPVIKKGLQDKVFAVRLQAVLACSAIGPIAKGVIPELLEIIREDDTGFLEAQATIALGKIGPAAISPLRKALLDKSATIRRASVFALGLMGPKAYEAVPDLAKALTDDEGVVRAMAAEALGKIGSEAKPALSDLTKALKDKEAAVQVNAALALWRINGSKTGVSLLAVALSKSKDAQTRRSAALALGEIRPDDKLAWAALRTGLKDQDEEVRLECVIALGKIGPTVSVATADLRPLLKDKNAPVRLQTVQSLWKINKAVDEKCLGVLESTLQSEAASEVVAALLILADIGPPAQKIIPALLPLAQHRDKEIRAAALKALQKIGGQSALQKSTK